VPPPHCNGAHAAAEEQYEIFRPERAFQLIRQGLELALKSGRFEFYSLQGELFEVNNIGQGAISSKY
jgi:hypothetical protein